ncbi:hypothetical protein [Collimonas fungivorans]|uniref:hypothetical protein n=1 Tax=Collimonas fungivorans TaxID=158899 RepID=UPI0011D1994B|nr:hypothetical protein [Collimonas fungivorans]
MLELRNGPRTLKAALGSLNERRTERGSALSIASDRSCGAASSTAADLFVDEGICMMVFFFLTITDYMLDAIIFVAARTTVHSYEIFRKP